MALYVYQCDTCGRTEEKFRRAEDRTKEFNCDTNLVDNDPKSKVVCPGKMKFKPIQKTNWKWEKYDGT